LLRHRGSRLGTIHLNRATRGTSRREIGWSEGDKNCAKRNKPMTLKTTLLASAALLLSAGMAAAAPATARSDLNVRSGPGTEYGVVGTLQGGETVDVAGCTGSWCQVSFSGGTGYASANYLAMAGEGGPGPGYAAVSPGYVDQGYVDPGYVDDYAYNDYYNDDYGPSVGFYVNPGFRHHRHGWNGRPGCNGTHTGNWQGRGNWNGGNRIGNAGGPGRIGNAGAGFNRGGAGFNRGGGGSPQMSAPTGMRTGGGFAAGGGGGARVGGGGGGAHVGGGGGGFGGPRH
jgi:uncharacterized protein YraI